MELHLTLKLDGDLVRSLTLVAGALAAWLRLGGSL